MAILAADYGLAPSNSPHANRVALQRAIAAWTPGTRLVLPEGTCRVGRAPGVSYTVQIPATGLDLAASGTGSTLLMSGDGGGVNWYLLYQPEGQGMRLSAGITLSGDEITNPAEQTHTVNVGFQDADVEGLVLDGVTMQDVHGDGLRAGANAGWNFKGSRVVNCTIRRCGRSGIVIQRGWQDNLIADTVFEDMTDQDLDGEASDGAPVERVLVERCTFRRSSGVLTSSIALRGASVEYGFRDFKIRNSTFTNCRVQALNIDGFELRGCTLDSGSLVSAEAIGMLSLYKYVRNAVVSGNTMTKQLAGDSAAVVQIYGQSGDYPDGVELIDNTLVQNGNQNVVFIEGAKNVEIRGNDLQYRGTTVDNSYGVWLRSIVTKCDGITIADNDITGQVSARLRGGVICQPVSLGLGVVNVDGNRIEQATYAARFGGEAASWDTRPTYRGNLVAGIVTRELDHVAATAGIATVIGGDATALALSYQGDPEGVVSAPVGSMCIRRDTSAELNKATGVTGTGWAAL